MAAADHALRAPFSHDHCLELFGGEPWRSLPAGDEAFMDGAINGRAGARPG